MANTPIDKCEGTYVTVERASLIAGALSGFIVMTYAMVKLFAILKTNNSEKRTYKDLIALLIVIIVSMLGMFVFCLI